MNQLNGFELAGRPMKVGHVTEKQEGMMGQDTYDNEELERHGRCCVVRWRNSCRAATVKNTPNSHCVVVKLHLSVSHL